MHILLNPNQIPIRTNGVLVLPVGGPLLQFLTDEWGAVHFENENVKFNILITPSKETNVQMCMRLMGKIAEAAFVQRCFDSREANQKWLEVAGVRIDLSCAENYIPIGTSLNEKEF